MSKKKEYKPGQFQPGCKPGPGRTPRGKGRISLDYVRGMQEAFHKLGGVRWLVEFAKKSNENGRTFMRLMAQFIPGATLQKILQAELQRAGEEGAIPPIRFVPVDVPLLWDRIKELEAALAAADIEPPSAGAEFLAAVKRLEEGPQGRSAGLLGEGLAGELAPGASVAPGASEGEDDPVAEWGKERAEREKERRAALERAEREREAEDPESWVLTSKD